MLWICLAMLFAASTAFAQMYKWVDKDGKVHYGNTPPPGSKTSSVKAPQSSASAAPAPASAAKDAKKPLTAAEQEQEYRKRQEDAAKAGKKAELEQQAKSEKGEACARTREYLATLQSGQRIARTNPSGERYYMDENQVAQETAKAQQAMQQACK
jgi:hypothetical protein